MALPRVVSDREVVLPQPADARSAMAADPNPADLLRRMLVVVNDVSTATYRLVKQERVNGKLNVDEAAVKTQAKPLKVYIRQIRPTEGMEVLYVTGTNGNKMLVNPAAFPWVNISLDPGGTRARAGRHHTVYSVGFQRITGIIARQLQDYRNELDKMLRLDPNPVVFDGRRCWQMQIDNPHFRFIPYTVKAGGESLADLGLKLGVSEQMIGEKIPAFNGDYQTPIPAGTVLQVPATYARRMTLTIDQVSLLLVAISIYDDQSLYERYEYHDLKPNVTFQPNEFTPEFKGYGY